ncbi:MAG: FeoA family protein [Sporomusaceae bacterium]|nr:FeoA family protein [Sporomusaceae bacterium]
MPLSCVGPGCPVQVSVVSGETKLKNQLLGFGILPGAPLEVLQKNSSSLVVKVRETRLMLPFQFAHHIHVH